MYYMHTHSMHICSVHSHTPGDCVRSVHSVQEQATLLKGGLEEGGVHTDWVQWSHARL